MSKTISLSGLKNITSKPPTTTQQSPMMTSLTNSTGQINRVIHLTPTKLKRQDSGRSIDLCKDAISNEEPNDFLIKKRQRRFKPIPTVNLKGRTVSVTLPSNQPTIRPHHHPHPSHILALAPLPPSIPFSFTRGSRVFFRIDVLESHPCTDSSHQLSRTPTPVGRSTQIDQEYFGTHITKTPETIRPLHVLRLSFKSAMDKHNTDAEYSIVNDLLQGIRQDLLIQRIKNPFSIAVNETHAKLSLRHNDLSEFRRCMTNLLDDYAVEWQIQSNPPIYQTTPISPPRFKDDLSPLMQEPSFLTEHTPEMVHLHILFLCMIGHYTQIQNLLTQLPPILASTYLISHAVSIVQTQRIGNWTRFSRLRTQFRDKFGADNPNFILLTLIQRNNNSVALHALMQSSRPTLPLPSLLHHLRIDKSVLTALIEQNAITVKNDAIECQAECSKLEKAKTLIQFDATGMDIRPVSDQSQKVAKTVGQKNTTFEAMKRKL